VAALLGAEDVAAIEPLLVTYNKKGEVEFWSSDGTATDKWDNLAVWIKEVWIEGE